MIEHEVQHFRYTGVEMGVVSLIPNVVYSHRNGQELTMSLFVHQRWLCDREHAKRLPVIVYFEGSGYLHPSYYHCMGQMAEMASGGFVVAMMECGSFTEGWSFLDIHKNFKTAIRYLRANADQYGIDPEHVITWGTSSGGTSAVFAALSGDMPEYKTSEYPDVSDAVQCVADMAGPQDLRALLTGSDHEKLYKDSWLSHADEADWEKVLDEGSTLRLLKANATRCPFYLAHSVDDELVPISQTKKLYDALLEAGYDVQLALVEGASHTQTRTTELVQSVMDFIKATCQ